MLQGTTCSDTQETKTEQKNSDDEDGEALLIFSVEIPFKLRNVGLAFSVWKKSCIFRPFVGPSSFLSQRLFLFGFAEINNSVRAVDSTEEEHDMEKCQSPEEESKDGAAAALEENSVSHGQEVPKESTTTSSPDTDSPVMINVDVSPRLKICSGYFLFIWVEEAQFLASKTLSILLYNDFIRVVDAGDGLG